MKWTPCSSLAPDGKPYAIQSGEWYISRAWVNGKCRYTVARGQERIGTYDSSDEAKARIERTERERTSQAGG